MKQDSSLTEPADALEVPAQNLVESSRIITETASDAIITIDENSTIVFANPAATKIFGYSLNELLGAQLTMLMPEYLRQLHRAGVKEYVTTGQKHISWAAVMLRGLHKSGHEISLELSFGEFQTNGQRFFTGIARDISKRKQIEKRLAALQKVTDVALAYLSLDELLPESLKRIREVLAVDTVAILLLRSEGDELVAWAAQGLQKEVELGVRIPVGKGFAGNIVASGKPIIIDDVSKADVYNPLLREKGIKSLLGVPLIVEGRPIGVLHVGKLEFAHFDEEDVRLLQLAADRIALAIENARLYQVEKAARAAAEEANRAKDEFLTILSHELRTPLTPIIGWVHILRNGILSEADLEKALSGIDRNAYNLKRLINDLLDMSAILGRKMRIQESDVSIAEILSEVGETMGSYAHDSGIELQLDVAGATSALGVKGDRGRLHQVFSNLVHNAIKFSPAGKQVQIKLESNAEAVIISIADQGEGIAPEFLPHVFDRFRQEDSTRTRTHGGLGLGLALAKSFIAAHHGTIEAHSEGENRGSVFVVKLPLKTLDDRYQTSPPNDQDETASRTRILLVENQSDTLEMLTAHFRLRGYQTFSCASGAEALELADRERFDVLISDVGLPEMDGLQLIRRLRQKKGLERIPAIALSGYASPADIAAAMVAGFNLHLAKPVDPAEISASVEQLLSGNTSGNVSS